MLDYVRRRISEALADYLEKAGRPYTPFSVTPIRRLERIMLPGDILLVEGDSRIATAIKYLTQSTWSHAALYVGDALGPPDNPRDGGMLVEADLKKGVIAVPLGTYRSYNTRICRPVGLTDDERRAVADFMISKIGLDYDLKNIFDLARYLMPTPPVPTRWRRQMLALGSGDPTRAICSSLIAQAYQEIRYPILPNIRETSDARSKEILHIRHHSLYAPRDFDLSPYFQVIKPTLEGGFDHRELTWYEDTIEEEETSP